MLGKSGLMPAGEFVSADNWITPWARDYSYLERLVAEAQTLERAVQTGILLLRVDSNPSAPGLASNYCLGL
jgi:hypothetical protein